MLSRLSGLLRCDLAIDLGTAATRVALPGEGIVVQEPSVVAVARRGNRVLSGGCAVGHLAQQMCGRTPDSISVVRPIVGRRDYRFPFVRGDAAVLSAKGPAAAVGFAAPAADCGALLFNVGGKTGHLHQFTSRWRWTGAVVAGGACRGVGRGPADYRTGGEHGDRHRRRGHRSRGAKFGRCRRGAIDPHRRRSNGSSDCRLAAPRHGLRIGSSTAEQLRISLGSAWPVGDERTEEVRGLDVITGLPRRLEVNSSDVRTALADPLARILDAVRATLDQCGPDLVSDLVDRGIVLCGGGALLRGFDRWFSERIGIPARVAPEATTAVVQGTLTCLEHLDQWRDLVESSDEAR